MDTSAVYPRGGTPPQPDDHSWFPGYTFVMNSNASANGNAGNVTLYTAPIPAEDGNNYIAQDAYYHPGAIQQDVSLTHDQSYDLNFWWATGQQVNFNGNTYDQWQVSLGGSVLTTTGLTKNPNHSSTPWVDYDYKFVWGGASGLTLLSFRDICNGISSDPGACDGSVDTSNGPPFSLLDNVSLRTTVPEPSTWAMILIGFAGLGYFGVRGRAKTVAVA
jgi:hypothetical protein